MDTHQQTIEEYVQIINDAYHNKQALKIIGANSKSFLGNTVEGQLFETSGLQGIIDYEPTELYIKAYAGTPLSEIESTLASSNQMLAFEPPNFNNTSTIGGVVASGLSGARRPFFGSVRDYVLGLRCINGKAEDLSFGGQVIKNVAGYDVSRLMTGAYGTLGLLTEISLRVGPKPEYEISFSFECTYSEFTHYLNQWLMQSVPVSAAAFENNQFKIRLSGKQNFIERFLGNTELKLQELPNIYWKDLNQHQLDYFKNKDINIWRLSVPKSTPLIELEGEWIIDWGGAQRWLKTSLPEKQIRKIVSSIGGHASLYYAVDNSIERFHPLSSSLKALHQNLKRAFDPNGILNPGKMYHEL